jgi:septal ring factor EnvC (AmiA/AmiB activator)
MSAASVLEDRLTAIAAERAQAVTRLDLSNESLARANADIARLDAEKAAIDAAITQLGD